LLCEDFYFEKWYNATLMKTVKMAESEKQISAESFDKIIDSEKGLVVAEFYSINCVPCKLMQGDLEAIDKEYSGKMNLIRVDVTSNRELAERYSVVSTPTIIMFAEKKPVYRILGYLSRHDLKERIEEQLKQIA